MKRQTERKGFFSKKKKEENINCVADNKMQNSKGFLFKKKIKENEIPIVNNKPIAQKGFLFKKKIEEDNDFLIDIEPEENNIPISKNKLKVQKDFFQIFKIKKTGKKVKKQKNTPTDNIIENPIANVQKTNPKKTGKFFLKNKTKKNQNLLKPKIEENGMVLSDFKTETIKEFFLNNKIMFAVPIFLFSALLFIGYSEEKAMQEEIKPTMPANEVVKEAKVSETPAPSVEPIVFHPLLNESNDVSRFTYKDIPDYSDQNFVEINNNIPFFKPSDITNDSFEDYKDLDSLGRAVQAVSNVGTDLMPTEEIGSIGMIKPSGWKTVKYECVDGKYLYNRCHLIGYQLTGEKDNEKNLITGTRSLNIDGQLQFENKVADYVKYTNNHVLYRATPIYKDNDLVALGVLLEAYSVEDEGKDICFNVFCYNVQKGISIYYTDGESSALIDSCILKEVQPTSTPIPTPTSTPKPTEKVAPVVKPPVEAPPAVEHTDASYILNKSSKKFHYTYCPNAAAMKESNKVYFYGTRDEAIAQGYKPCGNCHP